MSSPVAGIDLGTTNSAIAVQTDGNVRIIDIRGQQTMPSCVGLDPAGNIIVGEAARNQLISAPESTLLSIKRRMGEDVRLPLGGKEYSPEELSALILRELKNEAEKALGVPVKQAVITVPAFFNERQRKSTQIAGDLAGLEVLRILNEPTAAALAYGAGQAADEHLVVYDLGGGTFDVSVVVSESGVVEVKSSHGDTRLGGDDFDDLLTAHVVRQFKEENGIDVSGDARVMRRLKVVLERAKCLLSDTPFVRVQEEYLAGGKHLDIEISRETYQQLIAPLVAKTMDCVGHALRDAGLSAHQLDKVMMVGGSTRTPLVQHELATRLRREPRWEINPDLIVAMGAAVQGAMLGGRKSASILVDITPHTFSTGTLSHDDYGMHRLICVPLIPRNTPLPVTKAEVFFTVHPGQKEVEITAYQGESHIPEANSLIGEFMVENLSKSAPANSEIVIQFSLDLNGMLRVTATEKKTGLSKSVLFDPKSATPPLDVDAARKNIAGLMRGLDGFDADQADAGEEADDAQEDDENEAVTQLLATAKDLRKRAEALISRGMNDSDKAEIESLLKAAGTAVRGQDWDTLMAKTDALSDIIFYLED